MAKGRSRNVRKDKEPAMAKRNFHLRFLFQGEGDTGLTEEYVKAFQQKIKSVYAARAECSLVTGGENASPGHTITSTNSTGYVVILPQLSQEKSFNPNEFFQLPLPDDSRHAKFYHLTFNGKKEDVRAGLIVPAEALFYVTRIRGGNSYPDPDYIERVLRKRGFVSGGLMIHQESPFIERRASASSILSRLSLNLAWDTLLPLREARDSSIRKLSFVRENPLFRLAFFLTALAIFIILPLLSTGAGLSGDDEKHYQHAAKVYRYYTEDDPAALNDPQYKLNYYGQSFDFFTYLLIKWFNLEEVPYEARHVMVALTGAATILFTGLLVRLLAGPAAGWLALVLMFLSPRFLGHAFNNPLDVPFALGNIFTLYHLVLFLKKLPRISLRSSLWIAVGIGWTNGIRIGGLLLVPYLFLFAGLYLLLRKWPWKFFSGPWWRFALKGLLTLVFISVAGYLLSVLTWPYALQDIINHPIQAFKVMTNIQVSIRVLYDGLIHWSDHLPWHYIPKNILITVPVIILLGWMASLYTWYIQRKDSQAYFYFMLWFTVLFPVIFIIYRESNVYGGWRHMMFIYPSMVALAAMALHRLAGIGRKRTASLIVGVLVLAGLLHPLRHILLNYPNTYIYFNEWSGGINACYGKFETDYYANSLKPASDYFIEEILPHVESAPGQSVRVVSNSNISYYFRNHRDQASPFYSRYYDRGRYDWDYAILYCNYLHPFQLNNGLWPPKNTIHEVKVDSVVVAAIVERKNKEDHRGYTLLNEAMREQNPEKVARSITSLENAIRYDPHNEAAMLDLGNAYSASYRFEEARATMDRLLGFYPEYDKALNIKAYTYLMESQVSQKPQLLDQAITVFNQAIQSNHKFYTGYYNLGLCYAYKNDKSNAIYNLNQAIRYNGRYRPAYEKLAQVYEHYGDAELARSVRDRMSRIP
jgi:tetratricopeptide (TPR) repeat protein